MDSLTIFIAIGLLHCALFFLDTLFKSCSHYPYLYFLHNTGLQIELFRIKWFTTAFNRLILKCGSWRPRLLDWWFTLGARFSLLLFPVAIYIVIKTMVDSWTRSPGNSDTKSAIVLETMIPGINLPLGDIGYYVTTLITCSVVHELGHAIAAVREDVHISGVGLVVLIIVPVAYVHFSTEQYDSLPPRKQLSIICAGVWHNIVLSLFAMLLLTVLPVVLYPFFDVGTGVVVQNIEQGSPVLGPTGLQIGDKILAVNMCPVKDYNTWHQCILFALNHQSPGYCVPSELVREHDESVSVRQLPGGIIDCCSEKSENHLCFEYLDKDGNMPELPQHSCLPGRVVIETAEETCVRANDCRVDLHCLKPLLTNHTKLLRIERANKKVVIFLGHPSDVYHSVQMSDFIPIYYFIPSAIPEVMAQLCKYMCVFSAGLAIINIIPCFYLDGQYIIQTVSDIVLADKVKHKSVRHAVALFITICGTTFVLGNCLSIFMTAIF